MPITFRVTWATLFSLAFLATTTSLPIGAQIQPSEPDAMMLILQCGRTAEPLK